MTKTIVAPSILSLDYANVSEQLKQLNESKAEWLHFDVMDGHFVPNLTFGPDLLKGFKKCTDMVMDVHIMVEDPVFFTDVFLKAGADILTFHYEACKDEKEVRMICEEIHAWHAKAGVSVKPGTPISVLDPLLDVIDVVLIMSVEPGFGGQSFMEDMLEKVRYIKKQIVEQNRSTLIEIDGGINADTAKLAKAAGVDVLVAGSYVFRNDIKAAVESLL
ncbi:ribulose-phosphate 3-epimerase [Massilicoli timonensis]|uniref:ribulose-phosphate 3-epimerase n=1 Tax=Massilicoli timonensis TaxID=2015901 RepID=UPI00248C9ACE|nr:ribulose-phosphate 3-epimerase [Massilicoli timonensis]